MLDRRLHAFRPDLADAALRGRVEAACYLEGRPARIAASVADVRRQPSREAGLDTQFLLGEAVMVFDEKDGWAWIQSERDGYVGYVEQQALSTFSGEATHVVSAPRTLLYPEPDLKRPRIGELSMGSRLEVMGFEEHRGTRYALLASGQALIGGHIRPVAEHADDFVAVAETLLFTPYLWGGATAFGIDCSGLVQLSMAMAGRRALRDSDMQAATLGEAIEAGENLAELRRGDLVFWKGHVGIMANGETLLHANGHTMMVSREPLRQAIERIGYLYGGPTGFRRP
jgi:cell wall-associated NlpC family hydrolase